MTIIAAETGTPIPVVEAFPPDKTVDYFNAVVRLLKRRKEGGDGID